MITLHDKALSKGTYLLSKNHYKAEAKIFNNIFPHLKKIKVSILISK